MLRLVEANFTSAGKTDLGDRTPSGFLQVRHCDALRSECGDLGLQIVTHQRELAALELLRGMNPQLSRAERREATPGRRAHPRKRERAPRERAPPRHPRAGGHL